ncbi:hypothetical protein K439DRAFT_1636625 [Ramaria rubella]|nr:hypothetical protein K439DRAFT_1636625 [Ramaria rubella]
MPSLFQSLSAFFSPQRDGSHLRRDQAMVSVDDAFTVPPDAEYVSNSPYTYPPPAQGGSYDTVPQTSYTHSAYDLRPPFPAGSSRSRPASLLPIHHSPLSPLPNYPPLQQTWNRLRAWLDDQYPELADTLNWGILPQDLAHLELQLGCALPPAVRESYLLVDGQEAESSAGCSEGLFFGLTLLPFEDVVDEWRFWREVDDDPATGGSASLRGVMRSVPPGWIRREYSQRGWLPLVADRAGNYLGVDMNPDERGGSGQVIVFGRDFDTKVVMWRGEGEGGWARWLASFVEELESGEGFELGVGEGSEGSEDGVGYDGYFFDGSVAKSQGGEGTGGGLRLTGEYRGWAVLEAFADRSMRRWIEAGVAPPPTPLDVVDTSSNTADFTAFDAEAGPSGTSRDENVPAPQPNGDPLTSHNRQQSSISTNKLPAPKPVQLPTEEDLLPSPTYSLAEAALVYEHEENDEEMGGLPMREVDRTTPVQSNHPPLAKDSTLVPISPSPNVTRKSPSPISIDTPPQPPNPETPDSPRLIPDTAPSFTMDQPTISSPLLSPTSADALTPSFPETQAVPEEPEEPQPSVRLVGGGGISGEASLIDDATDTPDAPASNQENSLDAVLSGSSSKRKTEAV